MSRPIDLPSPDHWSHGTRARYVGGCRCDACRRANAEYSRSRAQRAKEIAAERTPKRAANGVCPGIGGGCGRKLYVNSVGGRCAHCRERLASDHLVSADRARRHLRALSEHGVGYRAVADACDVGKSILFQILTGKKRRIRKSTLERVLAVDADAIADSAYVDGAATWVCIDELLALGFSKAEIARRLGLETPAIQFRRNQVLARTEMRVRRLRDEVVREHQEKERVLRERCQCAKPILLTRESGVFCAKCDQPVRGDA